MVYLTKGGFWMAIGQIITFASIILLSIAFANLVPPDVYGTYKYLLSLAALFSIFTLPGMATAVSRAVARGDENSIHGATQMRIKWSLFGSAVALSCSVYYLLNDNITLSLSLGIIGAALPFFDTFTLYNEYLTGKKDFKTQTLFHSINQTVSISSLLLTLLITDNVLFIVAAYFIPLIITRFILYSLLVKKIPKGEPDKEVIKYGKHLSFINVLGVVASNTDTFLLWQLLGPQQVAIYLFALAIPEQIKGPLRSVSELAFPKFASQSEEYVKKNLSQLARKMYLYAAALIIISILYVLAAPFIFKLLFPQYLESVIYSQVFMLASVALVGTIPLSLLSAQKKIKEQYIFSIIQPVLQIIAYLVLIPFYGIWGAIIARVVMRGFYVSFAIYLTRKAFK